MFVSSAGCGDCNWQSAIFRALLIFQIVFLDSGQNSTVWYNSLCKSLNCSISHTNIFNKANLKLSHKYFGLHQQTEWSNCSAGD